MKQQIRIGALEHLNAQPLLWGLPERLPEDSLITGAPAAITDMLEAGEVDVGLIPAIDYLRHPEYDIVPDICIASHGAALSAIMICNRTPEDMTRVALELASRASTAVCKVLFERFYKTSPEYVDWSPDAPVEEADADGVVVIGDAALRLRNQFTSVVDLGEEWERLAGLPFVHAVWAGPNLDEYAITLLQEAKRQGMNHLARIAYTASERLGLDSNTCLDYLTNRITYHLGPSENAGLRRFQEYAAELELCPARGQLAAVSG